MGRLARATWWAATSLTTLFFTWRFAKVIAGRVGAPPIWDFLAFWLWGKAIDSGFNPYRAEHLAQMPLPVNAGPDFVREVIQVGCPYPPTTLMIFRPFANLPYAKAGIAWEVAMGAALVLAILLLARTFFVSSGAKGLLMSLVLTLAWPPVYENLKNMQTNAVLLVAIVMACATAGRRRAGLWLAIATLVKPLAICFALVPGVKRRWGVLLVMAGTGVALTAVAALWFGVDEFTGFFRYSATLRLPGWMADQHANQSVLGGLARWLGPSNWVMALYTLISLVVLACTARVAVRPGVHMRESLALTCIAIVLLFPSSLPHYPMAALPAVCLMVADPARMPGGRVVTAALLALIYGAMGLDWTLAATTLLWVAYVVHLHTEAVEQPAAVHLDTHGLQAAVPGAG